MTPLQLRLYKERKARLVRMKKCRVTNPIVKVEIPTPEEIPDTVVKLEMGDRIPDVESEWERPPKFDGWFWPAVPVDPEKLKVHFILKVICTHYEIPRSLILADDRHARIVRARMLVAYLARRLTYASFIKIGEILRKDHTTIIHSYYKLAEIADRDIEILKLTQLVKRRWHEDSQSKPDQDQQGGQVCNGLPRPQLGSQPDSASVGSP